MRATRLILSLLLASLAGSLGGQVVGVVPSRTTLDAILGATEFTETFATLTLSATSASSFTGVNTFDATSVVNGQGPGLINAGVSFSGTTLQWDMPGYYGAVANEILFNANTITITFTVPTAAFGVDVRDFTGYTQSMTATVYAGDGTTVLQTVSGISLGGTAIFWGYHDPVGIGRVTLANTSGWSPIVTNVSFAPVPEPSTVLLMLTGLGLLLVRSVRRRIAR